MDLEGYALKLIQEGIPESESIQELSRIISRIKHIDRIKSESIARTVLQEAKLSSKIGDKLLIPPSSGITAGRAGLGSRGWGDHLIHRAISSISGVNLDDAGICNQITVAVDGIHSRLSNFPLLAGFHAARACIRDVLVMGSDPIGIFSDIHLADDADICKLFDFVAGVSAVAEGLDIKYISGSTLRIGGDMVIGDRITGCVGCVGRLISPKGKFGAMPGDVIILTQGNGGGTISSIGIYHGIPELIDITLNLDTLRAMRALVNSELIWKIHAMSDITNGGIRQDGYEISRGSGVKLVIDHEIFCKLIHPKILDEVNTLGIDPLGISLDMIFISSHPKDADSILRFLRSMGLRSQIAGRVEPGSGCFLIQDGNLVPMEPRYRESGYTPIKRLMEEIFPEIHDLESKLEKMILNALDKKRDLLRRVS